MPDLSPQDITPVEAEVEAQPTHGTLLRLARSFSIYGGANIGIRALNFLLVIVYAHFLHPSDYGIIYLAEIIASFLVIFAGLSLDSALQRLYFQHNNDAEELRSYLGSILRFGLAWMIVFLGLTLILGGALQARWATHSSVPFYPYVAMAIATATAIQGVQYRLAEYQAARRPRAYALLALLLALLTAGCCMYGVVIRRGGAIGMMQGKLAAGVITFIVAAWSMWPFLTARFQWKFVRESLSFSLPLIPHLVMASGLVVADRFILEHYRSLSDVGIYSLAYTFGMVMYLVTQSLSQAWLPMFFDLAADREKNRQVLGRICSGLAVFLAAVACSGILLSPLFINVFLDHRYQAAARIVPLVVMGYLFHALFSLFDLSILQAKRTSSVFIVSLLAFSVNVALNFAMIPRWGIYGAAWATTIAYAVEAAGAFLLAQRLFSLPYRLPEMMAGLAIAGGALWLTQIAWAPKGQGALLIVALVPALGLLALLGRSDLQNALAAMRGTRKSGSTTMS
jgi:O-antigen/teichoic acid export membrane protein